MSKKDREGRRPSLTGPFILIGFGVMFLLNNLGVLDWTMWDVVFRLWPILIIAAGLDLLIGGRSGWGAILSLVLLVALVAGALWLFGADLTTRQALRAREVEQAAHGVTEADVTISPAVGVLRVVALSDSKNLVSGVILPLSGEQVDQSFTTQGNKATFSIDSEGTFGPVFGGWGDKQTWNLGLSPDVLLSLEFSIGAGQSDLDLAGLTVTDLDASIGVGRAIVRLPAQGDFEARISGALGQLVIHIPEGLECRIHFDTALVGRSIPPDYQRQDSTYTSAGYASASNRVDLEVDLAVGHVTIH